jgi:RimJ/RimL family protein N-acetyltransferase
MRPDLTLRLPTQEEEEEVLRAHRATSPDVPSFLHYYEEGMPFRRYLELLAEHIGYVVVPEFRRRGYATEILRQSLHIAREKCGARRILVTCDDDNIGSIRTIEKNGGILENVVHGPDLDKPKRRYWIDLT